MTSEFSKPTNKARFLMIGYGLVMLFWLSLENRDMLTVSLLGTGATIIYGGTMFLNKFAGQALSTRRWSGLMIGFGALVGAVSPIVTATLMFFKSSWHSHIYPDFPPQMIGEMLARIPIWTVSGFLLGLCCVSIILYTSLGNE